eukprot:g1815.t1
MREMEQDDSLDFVAQACEENIFEWHFVVRGPPATEFEGGLYHGRILLPTEYPFKPPSFMLLTKNGRFETNTKICLSISDYHPEHWQPSWSVRTALTALVAFLPSPGKGAIGSQDLSPEIRRQLAAASRTNVVSYGNEERQKLARELHAKLLNRIESSTNTKQKTTNKNIETNNVQQRANRVQQRASASDWMWNSLTYVLGFLILAILVKKVTAVYD